MRRPEQTNAGDGSAGSLVADRVDESVALAHSLRNHAHPVRSSSRWRPDGEPDHEARRSPFAALAYLLTQVERARRGAAGLAGNHVVIALSPSGPYVLLAHLQRGTVGVQPGDFVSAGQQVGACGNSGNSTQPHVHVQVIDTPRFDETAHGVPLAFHHHGSPDARVPAESEIITD